MRSQLVLRNCYKLATAHYWIYLTNSLGSFNLFVWLLFALCFSFCLPSLCKNYPLKKEEVVYFIVSLNECWPSREFLVLHNERSWGPQPCYLPVATFSNAYQLRFQDNLQPCFLVMRQEIEFWQNRSTKVPESLQFCKDTYSKFKVWRWLSFFFLPLQESIIEWSKCCRVK